MDSVGYISIYIEIDIYIYMYKNRLFTSLGSSPITTGVWESVKSYVIHVCRWY